jgi:hypothetical protein
MQTSSDNRKEAGLKMFGTELPFDTAAWSIAMGCVYLRLLLPRRTSSAVP